MSRSCGTPIDKIGMPITQSAKKALRQNVKRKERNKKYKNKIKGLTKKAAFFARDGKNDELKKIMPRLYRAIDKAAKIGILKKNTASRRKSVAARLGLNTKSSK